MRKKEKLTDHHSAMDGVNMSMPDSYTGDPLSIAECGQHGVYDIREIRCPKCASVADPAEKAAEEITVEVSRLGGSSRTRMVEIIRAAYAERDAERERSVSELVIYLVLQRRERRGGAIDYHRDNLIDAIRKAFGGLPE